VYTIVVVNNEPEGGPGRAATPTCVPSAVEVKSSEVVGVEGSRTVLTPVGTWMGGAGDARLSASVIDGKLGIM
jgi:hypothetical protein